MIDLIVIVIILAFGAIGYHKGFIQTIMTLVSSIVALILSFLMYPVINTLLKLTPLYTYMNKWIADKTASIEFGTGVQTQGNAITNNITWLPKFISEGLVKNNNQEIYKLLDVSNVTDYVSTYLTNMIIGILAIIITWFILKILFMFLLKTTDAIVSHLPIISHVNKMGGGAVGAAKGLLAIWIICLLIPVLITLPMFSGISGYITDSYLASWLYENNMILVVFNSIFKA